MEDLVLAGTMNSIAVYSFRILFFLSAILLMVIVLLQEGKGGGLASALGGQGAETFGVSSGGVNRVTLVLAGLFLVSALGHSLTFQQGVTSKMRKDAQDRGAPPPEESLPDDPIEEENGKVPGGGAAPAGGEAPAKETPQAPEKAAEKPAEKAPETPPVAPPPPPPAPAPTPAGGDKPK